MENTFLFFGHQIRVITNQPGTADQVIIDKGTGPLYCYTMGTIHADKVRQAVNVDYALAITDQLGHVLNGHDGSFEATTQETFDYFYLPSRTGQQMAFMCINGLLTFLYGDQRDLSRQVVCFLPDGSFQVPTPWVIEPEPEPESGQDDAAAVPGV